MRAEDNARLRGGQQYAAGVEDALADLQATLDFTWHPGGRDATDVLAAACHIRPGARVLDVGCGVGLTACYLARRYGCIITGIDHQPRLIARARQRAARLGLSGQADFQVADALTLSFSGPESGSYDAVGYDAVGYDAVGYDAVGYDAVIGEGVLAYVPDKSAALRAWMAVTRPGGYVGVSDATWLKPPTPALLSLAREALGRSLAVLPLEGWTALLEEAGLLEVTAYGRSLRVVREARQQLEHAGPIGLLRVWGRAAVLLAVRPADRQTIRHALGVPRGLFGALGYGVWAGRRP